jgi:hypothetical protein
VESDFASFFLQLAREGGSAAGGALFVGGVFVWMVLSGRLVPKNQFLDMRSQRDALRRELRQTNRAMRAGVSAAAKAVRDTGGEH